MGILAERNFLGKKLKNNGFNLANLFYLCYTYKISEVRYGNEGY